MPAGRPTKYDPDVFPALVRHWRGLGYDEERCAELLGISVRSFGNYLNRHPEFMRAAKSAAVPANIRVQNALLQRATGFEKSWTRTTVKRDATKLGPDGKPQITEITQVQGAEYYPPSVAAANLWLTNHMREDWTGTRIDHRHNATVQHDHRMVLDLAKLSDHEVEQLAEIVEKLNTNGNGSHGDSPRACRALPQGVRPIDVGHN